MNLCRVLEHIHCKFGVGYSAMDSKEKTVLDNMGLLTAQRDFVEAVIAGDLDKCAAILSQKPTAIGSLDTKDRFQSVIHLAVERENWDMLRFLAK